MSGRLSQNRLVVLARQILNRFATTVLLPTLTVALLATAALTDIADAAELSECREMLRQGQYAECIAATAEAFAKRRYGESWPVLQTEAEMALGQYRAALQTVERGVERYSWSLRLRWLGREAALRYGQPELAEARLAEIRELLKKFPWRYTDAEELVILGRIDQLDGKDVKDVLSERFEKARDRNKYTRGPWLAIGQLALDKDDAAFAAETYAAALEQFEKDPDLHFGMSLAVGSSDPQAAMLHLAAALEANPKHIPSLLFQVERLIQAESYEQAESLIQRVLDVNPLWPEAWACRAVIAHLTNDPRGEFAYRDTALARWKSNAKVDHLIGRLLSQHYRFSEGAAYQYRALLIDPDFVAAKRQLAQDLLRLGDEEDGWELAHAAYDLDQYNVANFNLLELHDELKQFVTLKTTRSFCGWIARKHCSTATKHWLC
ncbi:MAG: tetratricopeptide repeat protein [Planctomycetota bacterium]|jgi:tetratricopeptide (TPR) repeat protein